MLFQHYIDKFQHMNSVEQFVALCLLIALGLMIVEPLVAYIAATVKKHAVEKDIRQQTIRKKN
ncbi:hypothetical protein ACNAN0_06425 [Agrilactobacillus fermenti]|uniref:hypothetical protein n=1 Tax=Agrilactobacillus fermenti TaxID=2586909 RepID=UPI001E3796E0|nr:hypothetical protein [Agrilactobacillus fermenti]MCD2257365.1 hypothetical protein [Agrilactobacillus fermenti]